MDTSITAMISAGTAIIVVGLTNYFSKKREHEADWRKMKLERYREYFLALSETVEERVTDEAQAKYSDAVNSLQLVAPPVVLHALDRFHEFTSYRNTDKSMERHDQLLNVLVKVMRQDIQPAYKGKDEGYQFHLLGVPPRDFP